MAVYTGHLVVLGQTTQVVHQPVAFSILTDNIPIYGAPLSVECTIDNTDDYDLYYTVDGTDPTLSSNLYQGAFTIYRSCTISIRAIEKGTGWLTTPRTADFTLVIPVTFDHEDGMFFDNFELLIESPDSAYTLFYSINNPVNGEGAIEYVGPVTVSGTWSMVAWPTYDGVLCGPYVAALYEKYAHTAKHYRLPSGSYNSLDALVAVLWRYLEKADRHNVLAWVMTGSADRHIDIPWSNIASIDREIMLSMRRVLFMDKEKRLEWSKVISIDTERMLEWDRVAMADDTTRMAWGTVGFIDIVKRLQWGKLAALDLAIRMEWGKGEIRDYEIRIPWTKLKPLDKTSFSAFLPGEGTEHRTELKKFTRLPWVATSRIIMTAQNITFKRVSDDEPVHILTGSFGIDMDSYLWTFKGVVPSVQDLDKIKPTTAGKVEVELGLNGYLARFVISSYTANNAWGTGTYSIEGMSTSCVLGEPYCPRETKQFTGTTAQQIIANELTGTGFDYDWDLITNTWNINGEFSVESKTKIEIISDLAKAIGGVVQTDLYDKTIRLMSRHPESPGDYALATPDEYILQAILEISEEHVEQPKYNSIIVSGKTSGVNASIIRTNTPGDRPAPEIVEPLLTAQALNIERGRCELDETGYDYIEYDLTLPLPTYGSGTRPKMLLPGHIIEVTRNNETWRGLVTSVDIGWQSAKTRQRVVVRRHIL